MARLFFYLGVLAASLINISALAQADEYSKDIEKLLSINGSSASYDLAFDQIVKQFKTMKADAPGEVWEQLRTEVFDKEIEALNKQMVPVYKEYLSHDDVKGLIRFYESPLGKKFADSTGKITGKTMQMAQTWGMGLGQKISAYLTEKGF